jgi:hypothetical protein
MHPEFLTRLREEIVSQVGPTRRPTYDDIKEMKYLRAVLNGAYFCPLSVIEMLLIGFRNTSPFPCCVSDYVGVQLLFTVAPLLSRPFDLR